MTSGSAPSRSGILSCACRRAPVLEGIPIFKAGRIGAGGETADDLVALLARGRHREALLAALLPGSRPAPSLAPSWTTRLPPIKGLWRLNHWLHAQALPRWRRRSQRRMQALLQATSTTAQEFLSLYFRDIEGRPEAYHYFFYRYGMPRHLVALSFLSTLPPGEGPVLDLACGFGHLTHHIAAQVGTTAVGVDTNFFCLYVAARSVAPAASYVCCDLEQGLPFASHACRTVLCSDAFHYLDRKEWLLADWLRVLLPEGRLMTVSMRNASVPQLHESRSLSAAAYGALAGDWPHRLVSDRAVLTRYLTGAGPPLADSESLDVLEKAPLVSLVITADRPMFRDHGAFSDWPHAQGPCRLNPLYQQVGTGPRVRLRRVFPSAFYEEENTECRDYLPEEMEVSMSALHDAEAGKRSDEVADLMRRCVVLGIPPGYVAPLPLGDAPRMTA